MSSPGAEPVHDIDTLVIGVGRAGLATSFWLSRLGLEHQLLEQRPELGGARQDRWDSFYLNTPNFPPSRRPSARPAGSGEEPSGDGRPREPVEPAGALSVGERQPLP